VARRTLVTGAGGFVGAGLARRLLERGHDVTALVGPGSDLWRLAEVADSLETVPVDLRDDEGVSRAVEAAAPEWVFHLGAHGGYSWQSERRRIFDTNLRGTINVLEAAGRAGAEIVLCAGSSSEYGRKDHAPQETELPEPNSDYAVAKAAATLFASFLGREHGMPVATLRLYSVFGPFEDPARFIPALVVNGLRGRLPPLVDPAAVRDFVYLDDAVAAFTLAAERGVPAGAVFNVGTGVETSVAAAVESARALFSIASEPRFGSMSARAWETPRWVADPSQIGSVLGWRPTVPFADGLARTAAWLEGRPDLWGRYGLDRERPDS
jgi:dolichol-phosphate mannosyltransferase